LANFSSLAVRSQTVSVNPANKKKHSKPGKERLDVLLVERGLAPSRERAKALLLAGQVRVNGVREEKPGTQIAKDAAIEFVGETLRYASRAGLKLEGALEDFAISPQEKICLDIGSSTGGFTDCLLQHGAAKVHAVDVTIDQLDWKLRKDARVHTIECNARRLRPEDVGEPVDLVTIDVSFISVAKILAAVIEAAGHAAQYLILVKPQFELEKSAIGKGGIVRDAASQQRAVEQVRAAAVNAGLEILGTSPSRLRGAEGNQEFFLHAMRRAVE
jgi:23S rRNA (cytidine1920-2'-O)/16S rRNA (cytidine1409-2'-O)-methyltransferase